MLDEKECTPHCDWYQSCSKVCEMKKVAVSRHHHLHSCAGLLSRLGYSPTSRDCPKAEDVLAADGITQDGLGSQRQQPNANLTSLRSPVSGRHTGEVKRALRQPMNQRRADMGIQPVIRTSPVSDRRARSPQCDCNANEVLVFCPGRQRALRQSSMVGRVDLPHCLDAPGRARDSSCNRARVSASCRALMKVSQLNKGA